MEEWKLIIQRLSTTVYCIAMNAIGDLIQKNFTDKQIQGKEFKNNLASGGSILEAGEFPLVLSRLVLQTPLHVELPPVDIILCIRQGVGGSSEMKALPHLLVTTKGFGDIAKMTHGAIENSAPPFDEVLEVDEYIDPRGEVIKSPSESHINTILRRVYKSKGSAVQVIFANAYRNPIHEKIFLNLLRTAGYKHVYGSHE